MVSTLFVIAEGNQNKKVSHVTKYKTSILKQAEQK